ncbi:hypothetical protein Bca4012_018569 [Brassica carinata]
MRPVRFITADGLTFSEDQVRINASTGKPMITKEVLDHMSRYLQVEDFHERKIREFRLQQSIKMLEGDIMGQKPTLIKIGNSSFDFEKC